MSDTQGRGEQVTPVRRIGRPPSDVPARDRTTTAVRFKPEIYNRLRTAAEERELLLVLGVRGFNMHGVLPMIVMYHAGGEESVTADSLIKVRDHWPTFADKVVSTLRAAAAGRREYAESAADRGPDWMVLMHEAAAFDAAAKLIEGGSHRDLLCAMVPSWRWGDLGVDL